MNEIFQKSFLGNTIENYCWFLGIIVFGLLFKKLFSKFLSFIIFKLVRKYASEVGFDKLLSLLRKPLGIFILLVAFYIAFQHLSFPEHWHIGGGDKFGLRMVIMTVFKIVVVIVVAWIFLRLIDYFGLILHYKAEKTASKTDDQLIPFFRDALKVIVIILSLFFILGVVFKLNVASLIAGLGIGGLAVALAAKESLENLLGSFTIFLDQPFIVGDLVRVGDIEGNVEKIGFRSTRIRTAEKSYVTVPNKKMVDSELDNLSLRTQRRAKFNIGLSHDTTKKQFENIIKQLKEFIENHPQIVKQETQIRLHDIEPSAINIMIQYLVNTTDANMYLDVRQEINFKILEVIQKNDGTLASILPVIPVKK